MDPLTVALIVAASVVGYTFGAGATGVLVYRASDDDLFFAFLGGILWPAVLPLVAGVEAARYLTAPKRAALPEARTRKDLP